jgi:hypothetical protein
MHSYNSPLMSTPITLESIHTLLSDFIGKQTEFNTTVDAKFEKVDANFARVDANFARVDANFASLRDDMAEFRREEKSNHNLSHRMIMQSFEAISDIRAELDTEPAEPWLRK